MTENTKLSNYNNARAFKTPSCQRIATCPDAARVDVRLMNERDPLPRAWKVRLSPKYTNPFQSRRTGGQGKLVVLRIISAGFSSTLNCTARERLQCSSHAMARVNQDLVHQPSFCSMTLAAMRDLRLAKLTKGSSGYRKIPNAIAVILRCNASALKESPRCGGQI